MSNRKKVGDVKSAEGKNVVISNRKKWKFFCNYSNKWKTFPVNEITLNSGSTPVSVISVKENGQHIREFKLRFTWEPAIKRKEEPTVDWPDDPMDELEHEHEKDWDLNDSVIYSRSDNVVNEFATSDITGVSWHTCSFNCRQKQKLIPESIFIEGLCESDFLADVKSEYEIDLKFGHTLLDPLLMNLS